jgi:hypothetical protein
MKMMDNEELKSKLEKFRHAKIPIHIVLKKKSDNDFPRFLNGLITDKKTEDIYIIEERKIGKTYVFIEDIYDVSVFVKNNRTLAEEIVNENGFQLGEGVSREEIDLIKDIKDE